MFYSGFERCTKTVPNVGDAVCAGRGETALSKSPMHARPGGHCIIDIVGVLVRVSCPTEIQTDRPR